MPNRYKEYKNLLLLLLHSGYNFIKLNQFNSDVIKGNKKYAILRHDIDGDVPIANKMLKVELDLGIKSSYYLRLCTLNKKIICKLLSGDCEIGYHFEEIASYAYHNRVHAPKEIYNNLDIIRKTFEKNFLKVEALIGRKIQTIASHGDFVNRKLNMSNNILINAQLREKLGIVHEAYDADIMNNCTYFSDCRPNFNEVYNAIEKSPSIIYILVHSRNWASSFIRRGVYDFRRLLMGVKYNVKN